MVGTITPVGYGNRYKWFVAILLYTLGNIIAASSVGLLLSFGGQLFFSHISNQIASGILVIVSTAYSLHELGIMRMPYPQFRHQVPMRWRYTLPRYVLPLAYGLGLGVGFGTFISVGTMYVLTLGIILEGSLLWGSAAFMVFGLGRSLSLILYSININKYEEIPIKVESSMTLSKYVHIFNGFVLVLVAGWFLAIY